MRVIISVTSEYIAKGVAESCTLCPVAIATRFALPASQSIKVQPTNIEILNETGKEQYAWLPEAAVQFISDFDNNRFVEPFAFEIEIEDVVDE